MAVYANELVKSSNARAFHRPCFRCSACRISLSQGKDHELEGAVFCKNCHSKRLSSARLKEDVPLLALEEEEEEVGLEEQKEEEEEAKPRRSSREEERERRLSESVWFHQSIGD